MIRQTGIDDCCLALTISQKQKQQLTNGFCVHCGVCLKPQDHQIFLHYIVVHSSSIRYTVCLCGGCVCGEGMFVHIDESFTDDRLSIRPAQAYVEATRWCIYKSKTRMNEHELGNSYSMLTRVCNCRMSHAPHTLGEMMISPLPRLVDELDNEASKSKIIIFRSLVVR